MIDGSVDKRSRMGFNEIRALLRPPAIVLREELAVIETVGMPRQSLLGQSEVANLRQKMAKRNTNLRSGRNGHERMILTMKRTSDPGGALVVLGSMTLGTMKLRLYPDLSWFPTVGMPYQRSRKHPLEDRRDESDDIFRKWAVCTLAISKH
jgi:hypothetical protein